MTKRLIPLAALAALTVLACSTTVAPPAATPSASPSAAASAAASPAAKPTAGTSPAPTTAPATNATASPAASAAPAEVDVEGCEHGEEGPAKAVTANLVTMSRERARVADDHNRYDVTLVQSAGQYEGYVIFENDDVGDFHFYLNKDVPFKLMQNGKDVAFEKTTKPLALCPDVVKASYVAELAIGQVELHWGPTSESSVGVVIEFAAGEHGDE